MINYMVSLLVVGHDEKEKRSGISVMGNAWHPSGLFTFLMCRWLVQETGEIGWNQSPPFSRIFSEVEQREEPRVSWYLFEH